MTKRHRSEVGDTNSLFLRLEELVLANSGKDEFEEIFKLIIAKLFDEKFNAEPEFYALRDATEQRSRITFLLRRAEDRWPGVLEPFPEIELTSEHLSVCVQELSKHRLSSDSLEAFDAFFELLVSRSAKGNKGQYFTPRHVTEMCVRIIRPGVHEAVADPACGSGGFLLHALRHVRSSLGNDKDAIRNYVERQLWGFDIDDRATRIARTLLIIAADTPGNLFSLNSLLSAEHSRRLFEANRPNKALSIEQAVNPTLKGAAPFDVILTNPPFAGEIRERKLLDSYDSSVGKPRAERDVLFVERCLNLLKPGGRMAIVLPYNKFSSAAFRDLRRWVSNRANIVGVVSLGRNVFMPHTQQKTGVLFLRKKVNLRTESASPIFLAISEKDGKDRRGALTLREHADPTLSLWDRLDHDLGDIVESFPVENLGI